MIRELRITPAGAALTIWLLVELACLLSHAAGLAQAATPPGGVRWTELTPAEAGDVGFVLLPSSQTALDFTHRLQTDAYATNAMAHNGAGLAIGDVDGDGCPDIYLCSLEGGSQLYRILGNWHFERVDLALLSDLLREFSVSCSL